MCIHMMSLKNYVLSSPHLNFHLSSAMAGTFSYIAPELARTGKASPLTDVFSFGILLLEVTCGRGPIEGRAQDTQSTSRRPLGPSRLQAAACSAGLLAPAVLRPLVSGSCITTMVP
jgi:serine/threonine protein kinase